MVQGDLIVYIFHNHIVNISNIDQPNYFIRVVKVCYFLFHKLSKSLCILLCME